MAPHVYTTYVFAHIHMEVSLNYCSQNGGNVYRAPYYNRNPNIGPRIDSNLGQSPYPNNTPPETPRPSTLNLRLKQVASQAVTW